MAETPPAGHETHAPVVGRQSFADIARHDGGKGFPPYDYDYTPAAVSR
jgi:hypothetical protein